MDALQRYVTDCEQKRRRMRDRPSDTVLAELRVLLDQLDDLRRITEGPADRESASTASGGEGPSLSSPA